VSSSLTFDGLEGHAGEPLTAQLTVVSKAHVGSAPVNLNNIAVQLEGLASHIQVEHQPGNEETVEPTSRLQKLLLTDNTKPGSPPSFSGQADLTIHAGQTVVLEFPLIFREAGQVEVSEIILSIVTNQFTLNYSSRPEDTFDPTVWWKQGPTGIRSRRVNREDGPRVQILPRPPKMELRFPRIDKHFYTDEVIHVDIEVANLEDEDTEATLEVRLLTREGHSEFIWTSSGKLGLQGAASDAPDIDPPGHQLGILVSGESKTETMEFTAPMLPTEYVIEVKVRYHLLSDRDTPVSRTHSVNLNITRAFEANYDLQPRIQPDPWPSFFGTSSLPTTEGDKSAKGIPQRWHLSSLLASFAYEGLIIEDLQLNTLALSGGATLSWSKHGHPEGDTEIAPEQQIPRDFVIEITKASLEDRRATTVDLGLSIRWRRPDAGSLPVTSTIPVNSYTLPNSEPRVLASVSKPKASTPLDPETADTFAPLSSSLIALTYTLENPTTHFLTFDLTMDISDTFAFSGPAVRTLNLLPLSRESIRFIVLPMGPSDQVGAVPEGGKEKGGSWSDVRYKIVDRYFKKVLRVLAASEGIREGGKGGILGIWVPDVDGDE
jgi:trafficking protein particle complex subunit 11